MHTDAVQALGKIPLCERVALMSVSAHKIGGPQGVGALVVRGGAALEPLVRGGPQERRRRAGTENVAGIVGFGAAARAVAASLHGPARIAVLRDRLEADLLARYDGIVIHGRGALRVGNTSCFSLRGADGVTLQVALDLAGFSVSTGTACASGTTAPSYVLKEIGALAEVAKGAIRVSLGWNSTGEDIAAFLQALHGIVAGTHQGVSAAMPDRETVH